MPNDELSKIQYRNLFEEISAEYYDDFIKMIASSNRQGYQVLCLSHIPLVFRMSDLYFVAFLVDTVLFVDSQLVDDQNNCDPNILSLFPPNLEYQIQGMSFRYPHLGQNRKVNINWNKVAELLTNVKNVDRMKEGIMSVCLLTSESARFKPIANAIRRNSSGFLHLSEPVMKYVKGLSPAAAQDQFTLRHLLYNWGKMSKAKDGINVYGIYLTKDDIDKILDQRCFIRE